MATRLSRQLAAVAHRLPRRLNRIDDPAVSGATADVTVERFPDRFAVVALPLLDQMGGADDNAGNAEAALDATLEHEGFADDSPDFRREPFERPDVMAGRLFRLPQARQRRFAVNHHETAPAGA